MKKSTYTLVKEALKFFAIILIVFFISITFYAICLISTQNPLDPKKIDEHEQIEEMILFHESEGRSQITLFY